MSSTQITGFATLKTNVYHGPNSSVYASVGSIGPLETVNVLATSMGWYHIEYSVGSTNQRKTGYVPQSSLSSITGGTLAEEDFYGGYCYASTALDVRTCDDFSRTAAVGTLFQNEGCTFLFSYINNGSNIAFIEYSTSTGTKRGYVYSQYLNFPYETIVGIAIENTSIYAGINTSDYSKLGSVNANELVSVIAKNGDDIYVEYNTTGGRKRGYMKWNQINPRDYNTGMVFSDLYTYNNSGIGSFISGNEIVYGGPSTAYANIGSVNSETIINFTSNNSTFPLTYIEYWITGSSIKKSGYINPTNIKTASQSMENNTLTTLADSYSHFGSKITYGTTQLGREMNYYRAGNGNKHLFLIFAHHGWEDGEIEGSTSANPLYYHGDGNILVRIAKNFIERFESSEIDTEKRNNILNEWSIFVFPGVNLDGIVNGFSNDNFGRCLYNQLDPNRNWGGDFVANVSTPRNKTASTYFQAQELTNLRDILKNNIGTEKNILVDIHGWLNQTVGNSNIAQYYWNSLGIPSSRHSSGYGQGYLIAWAKNSPSISQTSTNYPGLGADSCLLELVSTTDYSVTKIEEDYGSKFFTGTINILDNC